MTESVKQLVTRHAGLRRQRTDLLGTEGLSQLLWRNGLVGPRTDP